VKPDLRRAAVREPRAFRLFPMPKGIYISAKPHGRGGRVSTLSEEKKLEAKRLYVDGFSQKEVGEFLKVDKQVVKRTLKKMGVEPRSQTVRARRHSLNTRFFQFIDTEEKAYWLGFLAADGNVSKCRGNNAITLGLSAKDLAHVELFAKAIGTSAPIRRARSGKGTECAVLSIYCQEMVVDLAQVGIVPCKSLTAKAWNGPEELMAHYWRGVFDGDGSIFLGKQQWGMGLCGSEEMMKQFSSYLEHHGLAGLTTYFRKGIWHLGFTGRPRCRAIADLLYSRATVYLPRKYELAQRLLSDEFMHRPPSRNKLELDGALFRAEYESGASTVVLSKRYGVSDTTINKAIRNAGGKIRTPKECHNVPQFRGESQC
jgi:transposase-like protein